MEVPDVYQDEDGNISREQLLDDLDPYIDDERSDEKLIMGIATELLIRCKDRDEFLRLVNEVVESGNIHLLDEAREVYGYGIMNVGQNAFIPIGQYANVQTGYFDNDDLVRGKDQIVDAFVNFVADHVDSTGSEDFSSFRIVEVRLNNSLDDKGAERVDEEVLNDE